MLGNTADLPWVLHVGCLCSDVMSWMTWRSLAVLLGVVVAVLVFGQQGGGGGGRNRKARKQAEIERQGSKEARKQGSKQSKQASKEASEQANKTTLRHNMCWS